MRDENIIEFYDQWGDLVSVAKQHIVEVRLTNPRQDPDKGQPSVRIYTTRGDHLTVCEITDGVKDLKAALELYRKVKHALE